MRNSARKIWLVVGMIAVVILAYNVGLLVFGYPRSSDPEEVAEWIVRGRRNPALCYKMNTGIGMSPSSGTIQRLCIHMVAEKMKDPAVCELLMPSSYGWSCLGVARDHGEACSINYGRDVSWWENTVYEPSSPSTKATIDECVHGSVKSEKGEKCCHILRVSSEKDYDDCSLFKNDKPFFDQCISQLALKLHKSDLCNSIHDANVETICIIEVKYE